jgi:hypothetical protein
MIPSNIDARWYRTYWFDEWPPEADRPAGHVLSGFLNRRAPRSRAGEKPRRIDPTLLGLVLLFAALAIGAVVIGVMAPVPPADLPSFVT